MKLDIVKHSTAILLKEKGFDCPSLAGYDKDGKYWYRCGKHYSSKEPYVYKTQNYHTLAPTLELVRKWFREVHKINIKVDDFLDDEIGIEWDYEIVTIGTDLDEVGNYVPLVPYSINEDRSFKTYEEALEEAIVKSLELI